MFDRFAVAGGTAWAALAATLPAVAGDHAGANGMHRQILPPVSGTISMPRTSFGRGPYADRTGRLSDLGRWQRPMSNERGFLTHPVYGQRGGIMPYQHGRYGYGYSAPARGLGWASGGTGLVGAIGDGGNAFAGAGTGWGTADSATTGGGDSIRLAYGEPDLWTNAAYGAPPRLGTYGSGAPSTMPYYSSGSSAGPNGSPGGLAVYSSGAYGPGPRVIIIDGRRHRSAWGQGCTCGPHIIELSPRHHRIARR